MVAFDFGFRRLKEEVVYALSVTLSKADVLEK